MMGSRCVAARAAVSACATVQARARTASATWILHSRDYSPGTDSEAGTSTRGGNKVASFFKLESEDTWNNRIEHQIFCIW